MHLTKVYVKNKSSISKKLKGEKRSFRSEKKVCHAFYILLNCITNHHFKFEIKEQVNKN